MWNSTSLRINFLIYTYNHDSLRGGVISTPYFFTVELVDFVDFVEWNGGGGLGWVEVSLLISLIGMVAVDLGEFDDFVEWDVWVGLGVILLIG